MIYKSDGGALVEAEKHLYIRRKADANLESLLQEMKYITLIGPRQLGKSSLLNSLFYRQDEFPGNAKIAVVSLEGFPSNSEDEWYGVLYDQLRPQLPYLDELDLPSRPKDGASWRKFLSILGQRAGECRVKQWIALDEVGYSVHFQQKEQFFSILRNVYDSRQVNSEFSHISFILTGTFNEQHLIQNHDSSPFNIGTRLKLNDFEKAEVNQLVHKGTWTESLEDKLADTIYSWTDGHPYMTHWICSWLEQKNIKGAKKEVHYDELIEEATNDLINEGGIFFHNPLEEIQRDKLLLSFIMDVLGGKKYTMALGANQVQYQLWLMGLIKKDHNHKVRIRNLVIERALRCVLLGE
jgi:hypothetical protein